MVQFPVRESIRRGFGAEERTPVKSTRRLNDFEILVRRPARRNPSWFRAAHLDLCIYGGSGTMVLLYAR